MIIFILTKKGNPYKKEYLVNDSSFIFNDSVTIEGNNISSPVIDYEVLLGKIQRKTFVRKRTAKRNNL